MDRNYETISDSVRLRRYRSIGWSAIFAADAAKSWRPRRPPNRRNEWAQWGGSSLRNNTPEGHNIPTEWNIGEFDYRTGAWDPEGSKNIKWVARLGSQTYGNPVVAGGHAYIGTNNSGGWLKRYPAGS